MTNLAFEHALEGLNVPFARAAVGDRYVLEMLNEKGWLFGGENSGHILCLDKHTTGDGIVSALQVLSALCEEGGDLAGLLGPVSYTHLDVYKRQGFSTMPDFRALPFRCGQE